MKGKTLSKLNLKNLPLDLDKEMFFYYSAIVFYVIFIIISLFHFDDRGMRDMFFSIGLVGGLIIFYMGVMAGIKEDDK